MNILDNPFYILDVSLSDNRRTIMSKVQDASLLGDPEKCNKAGSLLTNHKNRVKCEVFYLPELGKTEIKTKIEQLQSDPNNLLITILSEKIYDLSNGNLIASILLSSKANIDLNVYQYAIKALSNVLETHDPETVFHLINEVRLQSGFSQLADISLVSDALNDLKAYYLQTIKDLFKRLSSDDISSIMSELAINETKKNTNSSDFISSIVDYYEVLAQPHLNKTKTNFKTFIKLFNDFLKYKFILNQEEFDINDFKGKYSCSENSPLTKINTTDKAIFWVAGQISGSLSVWISAALPMIVVNKSNGIFYKACTDLVSFCMSAMKRLLFVYQTKLFWQCHNQIVSLISEKLAQPHYIDDYYIERVNTHLKFAEASLDSCDKVNRFFDYFSITSTKNIFSKKVLTVKFDYFQCQSSRYSWTPILDLSLTLPQNLAYVTEAVFEEHKIKFGDIFDSEQLLTCSLILAMHQALELAKDIMLGKKIPLTSQEGGQIILCDSGVIFNDKLEPWSDVRFKASNNDEVTIITDSFTYQMLQPDVNEDSFLDYILFDNFKILKDSGMTDNVSTLSEQLFAYSLLSKNYILAQRYPQGINNIDERSMH